MEARLRRAAPFVALSVLLTASVASGASHRTDNFMVTASSPQLAQEVCQEAERFRRELAVEWLGQELPRWPAPCPITVQAGPRMPATGATSFIFMGGQPRDFRMSIQGTRERVLDSVLPHEVTHTIFATHFGQPLPRWADEGGCTTVEHPSETEKMHKNLYQFLTSGRGIAFNQMFAMKEYPQDILPLYAQGFSLAKFFIGQGGKRRYIDYIGKGMETNNWTAATREFYGYQSLSDLQNKWLDWVRGGCPALPSSPASPSGVELVSHESELTPAAPKHSNSTPAGASTELIPVAPQDRNPGAPPANAVAAAVPGANGGSWYVRPAGSEMPATSASTAPPTNSPASATLIAPPAPTFLSGPPPAANSPLPHRLTGQHLPGKDLHWLSPLGKGALAASGADVEQSVTRPPQPEQPREIILEWSRGQGAGPPGYRAAVQPGPTMLR